MPRGPSPPRPPAHSAQGPPRLKLLSINIRGLNTPEKRSRFLYTIQREKAHLVLIQETHFRADSIPKLHSRFYPMAHHAANVEAKSRGVSILVSKHCPFQISDVQRDTSGRYLFLKGTLYGKSYTIANVYAPNSKQVSFMRDVFYQLTAFTSGTLIVGGDFNTPLSPLSLIHI